MKINVFKTNKGFKESEGSFAFCEHFYYECVFCVASLLSLLARIHDARTWEPC